VALVSFTSHQCLPLNRLLRVERLQQGLANWSDSPGPTRTSSLEGVIEKLIEESPGSWAKAWGLLITGPSSSASRTAIARAQ